MMDIRGLACVVAQATHMPQWKAYAEGVMGMQAVAAAGGGLRVKMDERQSRIAVQPGASDAYVASGWEVAGAAAFEAAVNTLKLLGVAFERGDPALSTARGVQALVSFADPSGNRHEVVWGFQSDFLPIVSPVSVPRFVTGEGSNSLGMGHVVLPTIHFDSTVAFAGEVMGFGLLDIFNRKPSGTEGVVLPIHFFHCNNGRHHSLALSGFPVPSGCVHIMVAVDDAPQVCRALDRMLAHHVVQSATLGQHTNDRMISFYMRCPSNFDIEFGCGGAGPAPRCTADLKASMADKRMSATESVAHLKDGMTLGIGGWGPLRKPMALVREILRSPLERPDAGVLRRR